MDARTLARALGGDVVGRDAVVCPGPGHSRRDRSLSIKLTLDGFICFSHAGDDWKTCDAYIRERLGWPQWQPGDGQNRRVALERVNGFDRAVVNTEAEHRKRTAEDLERIARAGALWNEGGDPRGSPVEQYLHARRLDGADFNSDVLRFHPYTPWRDEDSGRMTIFISCLLTAFRSIDDGTVTAVHRIRLDRPKLWPKTERRMLGAVARAAVMLDPLGDTLAVGEGVETCLAARQLGYGPVWALGSTGMICKFPVLDGVARLRVLGEAGTASADAIKIVARRWHAAKRDVEIVMPDAGYSDLNDELMGGDKNA